MFSFLWLFWDISEQILSNSALIWVVIRAISASRASIRWVLVGVTMVAGFTIGFQVAVWAVWGGFRGSFGWLL